MMAQPPAIPAGYAAWRADLKGRIHATRLRAALAVNSALISLSWQIGRDLRDRQAAHGRGAKAIGRPAADLRAEFPDARGFPSANLRSMRAFATAWPDPASLQRVVGKFPWDQNIDLVENRDARRRRAGAAPRRRPPVSAASLPAPAEGRARRGRSARSGADHWRPHKPSGRENAGSTRIDSGDLPSLDGARRGPGCHQAHARLAAPLDSSDRRHRGCRWRSGAAPPQARAAPAASGWPARSSLGPARLADDARHLGIDVFERAEAEPFTFRRGALERGDKRGARRFLTLQQAHTRGKYLGQVPITAARDGTGRKALKLRGKDHGSHPISIGPRRAFGKPGAVKRAVYRAPRRRTMTGHARVVGPLLVRQAYRPGTHALVGHGVL